MSTKGIVAFAYGVPDTIRSNRLIAQIALQKARELNAPVYTQNDVNIVSILVFRTPEEPGNPPPTLRIARGAVQWAKHPDNRLVELWVVAAKPHLWRCMRDMKAAVQEVGGGIVVRACEDIGQVPEDEWFCSDSPHRSGRDPARPGTSVSGSLSLCRSSYTNASQADASHPAAVSHRETSVAFLFEFL